MGMEITALKSKIQDSKPPKEAGARKKTSAGLTGNYTVGPLMSTHASILVDSVGPPSAEVCRTATSFP